jgi:RpiB/LacA/LacB family sugar-phosphate isomerase
MRVAIACDHAGFPLKGEIVSFVEQGGHEVLDLGSYGLEPVDYPDYAEKLGIAITSHQADRGILICGSGVGASIAANKIRGIYAAVCHDTYSAHQGVEHDHMNVLCLGARIIGVEMAKELVNAFLKAQFSTEERHRRRVAKVRQLEAEGHIR